MLIRNYLLILIFSLPFCYSQTYQRELNSIPFSDPSGLIRNAFSGGINNFEFQFVDIDGDSDKDIIFLDSDNTFGYYLREPGGYTLSLSGIPGFYASNWFYLTDIDNDDDYDLFTKGAENYIRYYENTGSVTSPLFTLSADTLYDADGNPVFTEFSSNPVFSDVDADGDHDFISGNSAGTLTFYENTGNASQYDFKFITNEWQGIIIIGTDGARHGASSLEFADIDNDADKDLFWGDFFSKSIYFIRNNGTPSVPDLEVELRVYPPNEDSIKTSGFNMPRLTDIDSDGDLDLFVSVLYDPTVPQTLLFYRNNGSAVLPDFSFESFNYLPTLDAGTESVACFTDIDNDGDRDLFLGSSKNPEGSILYFNNTGTSAAPSFNLADSVFSGITGELSLAPFLADIDSDGDKDLLVGNFDGTVSFFRNDGTPSQPSFIFIDKLKDQNLQIIDAGLSARPFLIDLDNDSDPDMVLGGFSGEIYLFQNNGTPQVFLFQSDTLYFDNIDVGDNSTPHLTDYDQDGDLDLFSGNRDGKIIFYKNNGSNVLPVWDLITDHLIEGFSGAVTAPLFCDIDNDSDQDLFVGNIKGGLYFYRNTIVSEIKDFPEEAVPELGISAFPNPFNSSVTFEVRIPEQDHYKIKIYNPLGEEIFQLVNEDLPPGRYRFHWRGLTNFNYPASSGNYIVVISSENYSKSENIILLK